jgi:hypothetical protein
MQDQETIRAPTLATSVVSPSKFSEDQARAWLAENRGGATVRELADQWGWHRSSVQRFLSRIKSETGRETGETSCETTAETQRCLTIVNPPVIPRREDDGFDWSASNPDVVVPEQRPIAVYANPYQQVVLRVEGTEFDDGDPFIAISVEHVPAVIEKMRAVLKELEGGG